MGKYSSFILGDGQDSQQEIAEKTPMGAWSSFILGDTGETGSGSSTDALNTRLQFKADLVRKLDYIREKASDKDNFDIGGGVKASEALKFVNSSAFNSDDVQRMAPLIQSIDAAHKSVADKRNILEVGADAFKRGYLAAGVNMAMLPTSLKPGKLDDADIENLKNLSAVGKDYETRNAPRSVGGVQEIMAADGIGEKASKALRFGIESIAENAPQMAASIGVSAAAGILGGPGAAGAVASATGAGIGSIPMNYREAVEGQLDNGLELDRRYALAQTAGYSAIDSVLSVEKMAGGVISQVFKKTAAQAGRKAFMGTMRKVAGRTGVAMLEEGSNELAESAGVARGIRYLQTGS